MQLEQQVISLELAKRLKELGLRQESYFQWRCAENDAGGLTWWIEASQQSYQYPNALAAFTVAELHQMLPEYVSYSRLRGDWYTEADQIEGEEREGFKNRCFTDESEAESAGNCLAYLIENKLI